MLPTFLIIGAAKAGTTSLHHYLQLHPDICMSNVKELNFFIEEVCWHKGVDWYASRFDGSPVRGEGSPSYANFPVYDGVPQRAASVVPDAKLIYCVRDPVDRVVSHFRMERARAGDASLSLPDVALRHPRNPYIRQSKYWLQLSQWLDFYPAERVLDRARRIVSSAH